MHNGHSPLPKKRLFYFKQNVWGTVDGSLSSNHYLAPNKCSRKLLLFADWALSQARQWPVQLSPVPGGIIDPQTVQTTTSAWNQASEIGLMLLWSSSWRSISAGLVQAGIQRQLNLICTCQLWQDSFRKGENWQYLWPGSSIMQSNHLMLHAWT